MISPRCDKCKEKLNDFGALAFSPPNDRSEVTKYHFCKPCWKLLVEQFLGISPAADEAWHDGLLVCRWFGGIRDRVLDAGHKIEGGTGSFNFDEKNAWCSCVIKGKKHHVEISRDDIRRDFDMAVATVASVIIADAS